MKIAVFGASGRTGILIVYQALHQGHQVTAFTRVSNRVTITHKNLRIVEGNMLDYAKVKEAVGGQDAVLSALGVESRTYTSDLSEGTRNIIHAMEECHVKRFICQSSAGILKKDAGFIFSKIIIPIFIREVFEDKKRQAKLIQDSNLEWVIVRPVDLTLAPKTNTYKVREDKPSSRKIPRADVADFMIKCVTDRRYDRTMPILCS